MKGYTNFCQGQILHAFTTFTSFLHFHQLSPIFGPEGFNVADFTRYAILHRTPFVPSCWKADFLLLSPSDKIGALENLDCRQKNQCVLVRRRPDSMHPIASIWFQLISRASNEAALKSWSSWQSICLPPCPMFLVYVSSFKGLLAESVRFKAFWPSEEKAVHYFPLVPFLSVEKAE